MNNSEEFGKLVKEFLSNDSTYSNEINNLQSFLKDRELEDKVFNLNTSHIDDYFIYSFDAKIGAVPTLTTHISALKSLFDFMMKKNLGFQALHGYISSSGFKENLSTKLDDSFRKQIISINLLTLILSKLDKYIVNNIDRPKSSTQQNNFFEIMIVRLFIKLSLMIPLKASDMLNIIIEGLNSYDFRTINHNNVVVKLPNGFRLQIIDTIEYAKHHFGLEPKDDRLFHYLYAAIRKMDVNTSMLSASLEKAYAKLDIKELLQKVKIGKKNYSIYPAESYKATAIFNMLDNGTNVVNLKRLTGLDFNTLGADYNFDKEMELEDVISTSINVGIIKSEYYTYI